MDAMKETNVMHLIMLGISKFTKSTLFRNNTGTGWVGKISRTTDGGMYISEPRPLNAGLCKGSSDLIGWTTKEITPEMVGNKIAIFTALEVKKTKVGRASVDQVNFIKRIKESGGIAGFVTSEQEAINILNK